MKPIIKLIKKVNAEKPIKNSTNWNDGYDRAIEDVIDVIADYFSSTTELADWSLRDAGKDPEKIASDGLQLIEMLKSEFVPTHIQYVREWFNQNVSKNPITFNWYEHSFMRSGSWFRVINGARQTAESVDIETELNRLEKERTA